MNQFLADLQEAEIELDNAVAGLDDETAARKPAPDVWSVSQCVEHMVMIESSVFLILRKQPDPLTKLHTENEILGRQKTRSLLLNRSNKVKLPEPFEARMKGLSFSEGRKQLEELRDKFRHYLAEQGIPYPELIVQHPVLGNMTKIDWLLTMPPHSLRHTDQIREIRSTLHI
jgi:hypothetical protein